MISDNDKKFAARITFRDVKGTKAQIQNEVRCRFPPPNDAERKLWNKGNAPSGTTQIMDAIAKYGDRTGVDAFSSNILQLGWQDSKGNLRDPARVPCNPKIKRLKYRGLARVRR